MSRQFLVVQDAEDRSIAALIHQALVASIRLELFPKSTIDVFITIIENDGIEGCIAAGSVAASTALADAGVEMIGLVMSCSAVSSLSWHAYVLTSVASKRPSLGKKYGWTRRRPNPWRRKAVLSLRAYLPLALWLAFGRRGQ